MEFLNDIIYQVHLQALSKILNNQCIHQKSHFCAWSHNWRNRNSYWINWSLCIFDRACECNYHFLVWLIRYSSLGYFKCAFRISESNTIGKSKKQRKTSFILSKMFLMVTVFIADQFQNLQQILTYGPLVCTHSINTTCYVFRTGFILHFSISLYVDANFDWHVLWVTKCARLQRFGCWLLNYHLYWKLYSTVVLLHYPEWLWSTSFMSFHTA